MDEQFLKVAGLSKDQAKIYTFLISNGLSNAKTIAKHTNLGRALTYKILNQLIASKLVVERNDLSKISLFSPIHPEKLRQLAQNNKNQLESDYNNFEIVYRSLLSNFNLLLGKPNIQFYESIEGIKIVYDEILDLQKNVKIISSPISKNTPQIKELIIKQIEKQAKIGIKVRSITPRKTPPNDDRKIEDVKNLIERKFISSDVLNIPAQIVIYGDKVAITNFKEIMITVVIESAYIRETFEKIFDYIWNTK